MSDVDAAINAPAGGNIQSSMDRPITDVEKSKDSVQPEVPARSAVKSKSLNSSDSTNVSRDYSKLLNFPLDMDWTRTFVLQCDPAKCPYRISDFLEPLKSVIDLKSIEHLGSSLVNYVYIMGVRSADDAQRLKEIKSIQVKGATCNLTKAGNTTVTAIVHWLPPEIPNELIAAQFVNSGNVQEVEMLKCKEKGLEHVLTNRRRIKLELKQGLDYTNIPYIIKVKNMTGLVTIPGRPPVCFKCRRVGHVRKDCRVEKCTACSRFGHTESQCPGETYASKIAKKKMTQSDVLDLLPDKDSVMNAEGEDEDRDNSDAVIKPATTSSRQDGGQKEEVRATIRKEAAQQPVVKTTPQGTVKVVKDHQTMATLDKPLTTEPGIPETANPSRPADGLSSTHRANEEWIDPPTAAGGRKHGTARVYNTRRQKNSRNVDPHGSEDELMPSDCELEMSNRFTVLEDMEDPPGDKKCTR